jgi:hypothetical protein
MSLLVDAKKADDIALQAVFSLKARKKPPAPVYAGDPVGFITKRLGEYLWSKQEDICKSVANNRRTAVASCHAAGKSFLSARIVAYWLETHKPGEAFVVTTAPSAPQVKAILWREINRAHAKGKLGGRTNQTEWYMMVNGSEELVAFGRKPSDYDPSAFQGIHARYVLVVLDEAGGIPDSIYNAAASLTANEGSRTLAIGNPDDPTSHFAKVCAPDSGWNVINIDAYDSPNFTDEWVPDELRELLISHTYVNEMIQDVGEDSPIFESKVRGRFPEIAEDVVIQLSYIRHCQRDRELSLNQQLPVELGVDVGGGGDKTTARERRGLSIGRRYSWSTPDPKEAAGHIVQAIHETGATRVKVDSIGIGWAMAGWLQAMRQQGIHDAEIVPVNVATSSTNPQRYPRLRDQLWWEIGHDAMQRGILDLRGLDDTTIAQLIAPKWKPDSMGRIQIEKKEETKKRIKRSPDDGDALLLAFANPGVVAGPAAVGGERPEGKYVPR